MLCRMLRSCVLLLIERLIQNLRFDYSNCCGFKSVFKNTLQRKRGHYESVKTWEKKSKHDLLFQQSARWKPSHCVSLSQSMIYAYTLQFIKISVFQNISIYFLLNTVRKSGMFSAKASFMWESSYCYVKTNASMWLTSVSHRSKRTP